MNDFLLFNQFRDYIVIMQYVIDNFEWPELENIV